MVNEKFIRNYALRIQTTRSAQDGDSPFDPSTSPEFVSLQGTPTQPCPFTLELNIVRNVSNSAHASFRIYNLGPNTRKQILRDTILNGAHQWIEVQAGYGLSIANLPVVFSGYINNCTSNREGVNVVTTIECIGFDYQYAHYSGAADSGVTNQQTIQSVLGTLAPQVQVGAIGQFLGESPTGQSYSDFTVNVLNDLTTGAFFIDNTRAYCLNENEYISNPNLPMVNAATGLLGSPIRRQNEITMTMLFEPRVRVAQQLIIQSTINPFLNNTPFKVWQVSHRATISPVVCGDAITEVSMQVLTNGSQVQGS